MEVILFSGVGVLLYLLCDRLLLLLENLHGEPLPARSAIFFVLILTLSLSAFGLIRTLLHPAQSPQYDHEEQQTPDRGYESPKPH